MYCIGSIFAKENGGLNHHYFYMNKNGEKVEILQVDLTENKKPTSRVLLIGFIEKKHLSLSTTLFYP